MRQEYFETLINQNVFQRIGYSGPDYYVEKQEKF
ncbi:MAG: hypothetical protein CM15mP26_2020 [Actinomycetota bacterium]|nr:MAG: hypothetical protein CM15mP26_2020 [Actinomycetota bacterium]